MNVAISRYIFSYGHYFTVLIWMHDQNFDLQALLDPVENRSASTNAKRYKKQRAISNSRLKGME